MGSSIYMKIVRASEKDLPLIVEMKMKMFESVGTISLLQDNAAKSLYENLGFQESGEMEKFI